MSTSIVFDKNLFRRLGGAKAHLFQLDMPSGIGAWGREVFVDIELLFEKMDTTGLYADCCLFASSIESGWDRGVQDGDFFISWKNRSGYSQSGLGYLLVENTADGEMKFRYTDYEHMYHFTKSELCSTKKIATPERIRVWRKCKFQFSTNWNSIFDGRSVGVVVGFKNNREDEENNITSVDITVRVVERYSEGNRQ